MGTPSIDPNPLAELHQAVIAHGVSSVLHADHLLVDDGRLRLEAEVLDRTSTAGRFTVTLEVRARATVLGDTALVVEHFSGVGQTREQAVSNAFFKMLLASFHVFLETLTSHRCQEGQVEVESWRGPEGAWQVHTGPLVTQGEAGPGTHLRDGFADFLADLQVLFEDTVEPGPHWVRVFLGAFDGECKGSEVLLDNEPWEGAHDLLLHRPWRWPEQYQSLRVFLIALPAPRDVSEPTGWERFKQRLGMGRKAKM